MRTRCVCKLKKGLAVCRPYYFGFYICDLVPVKAGCIVCKFRAFHIAFGHPVHVSIAWERHKSYVFLAVCIAG
jgi:hypothetical protein